MTTRKATTREAGPSFATRPVVRVPGAQPTSDQVAVESPLQVVLNGSPFAVIMRTPGDDRALVLGFLLAEGVLSKSSDIVAVTEGRDTRLRQLVAVTLDARVADPSERRRVGVNAACGMCGRVSVDSIEIDRAPLTATWRVDASMVASLPVALRARQPVFEQTGGLHAAGLFSLDGELLASAEDVGRHNAVDKVIGRMLIEDRLPLTETMLVVSGRAAYEIVQKALLAGIPLVAAVSAPSSLAVDLAAQAGITLAGFVRGHGFNVYSHAERIEGMS